MMMQLKNLIKSFAGNIILQNINIDVQHRDRIAIVGRNGAGKSTLLKMMTGEMGYDDGEIIRHRDLEIGYLAQHNDLDSERTIYDELLTVFDHFMEEEKMLVTLAAQIEEISNQGNYDEKLIHEYSNRQEKFEEAGGYRYKSDVRGILIGLGFTEEEFSLYVNELSGGQKTRLALGKLLLQKPSLLILDEPTNHLDISTLTWLENYLLNYEGALIIVSHDRYFLDKIVNIVYEVAHQQVFKYHGTYTQFLQTKEANYERDMKMYERQQKEIKEMEEFVQRNIARASTTKRAQSRRTQLEKMAKMDRPLGDASTASFSFDIAKTSGNDVLMVEGLAFTYPGEAAPIFQDVTFMINRGERIALIGENGVGKTTLLKLIVNEQLDEITLGTNVQIGYYAQEQEKLTDANTVLDEVWDDFPDKTEQSIRTVLGNFLFTGDDVLKHIHQLSGGEKARVALAKLMLQEANFLILDEPTNHLDLVSKEVLENALEHFSGTVLFVSHDRYFINKITDRVFELENDGLTVYLGDYDYFVEKKLEAAEIAKLEQVETTEEATVKQPNLSYEEQKRYQSEQRRIARQIEQIESDIETNEALLEEKETAMTSPEMLNDHEALIKLAAECEQLKEKMDALMEEWAALQDA